KCRRSCLEDPGDARAGAGGVFLSGHHPSARRQGAYHLHLETKADQARRLAALNLALAWPGSMLGCMQGTPLLNLDLPGIQKLKSGKVREIFDLGNALLLVATDRISAFDCIMPNGIPRKGEVLTQISHFWFDRFASLIPNHRLLR